MSNLLWSLPLLNCPFDMMCHTSGKAYTVQGVQWSCTDLPTSPKGNKCQILNLELGKVVQRNGYEAAGHKLWGKTRLVVNFNAESFQIHHILVPYGSKKDDEGKDRSVCFFLVPYIKLRTKNLPIQKKKDKSVMVKKKKKTRI